MHKNAIFDKINNKYIDKISLLFVFCSYMCLLRKQGKCEVLQLHTLRAQIRNVEYLFSTYLNSYIERTHILHIFMHVQR